MFVFSLNAIHRGFNMLSVCIRCISSLCFHGLLWSTLHTFETWHPSHPPSKQNKTKQEIVNEDENQVQYSQISLTKKKAVLLNSPGLFWNQFWRTYLSKNHFHSFPAVDFVIVKWFNEHLSDPSSLQLQENTKNETRSTLNNASRKYRVYSFYNSSDFVVCQITQTVSLTPCVIGWCSISEVKKTRFEAVNVPSFINEALPWVSK